MEEVQADSANVETTQIAVAGRGVETNVPEIDDNDNPDHTHFFGKSSSENEDVKVVGAMSSDFSSAKEDKAKGPDGGATLSLPLFPKK
jgi:hypothetical protein